MQWDCVDIYVYFDFSMVLHGNSLPNIYIFLIGTLVVRKSQSFVVLKNLLGNHTSCVKKINGRYLLTITVVISSQDNETILHQRKES